MMTLFFLKKLLNFKLPNHKWHHELRDPFDWFMPSWMHAIFRTWTVGFIFFSTEL